MLAVLDLKCSDQARQSVQNARLGKIKVPSVADAVRRGSLQDRLDQRKQVNSEAATMPPPPYLDRIATTGHLPTQTHEDWRRLLIQPVSIPALGHTGLCSAFSVTEDPPLIRPDGTRSKRLANMVKTSVRSYNPLRSQANGHVPGRVKGRQRGLRGLEALESSKTSVPAVPLHKSNSHLHSNTRKKKKRGECGGTNNSTNNNSSSNGRGGGGGGDNDDVVGGATPSMPAGVGDHTRTPTVGKVGKAVSMIFANDENDEQSADREPGTQSTVMSTLHNHTMRVRARRETASDARSRQQRESLRLANAEGGGCGGGDYPAQPRASILERGGGGGVTGGIQEYHHPDPGANNVHHAGGVPAYDKYEERRRGKVKKVVAARSSSRMLLESMLDSVYGKTR